MFSAFQEDHACRWIAIGEHTLIFSLVFLYQPDLNRMQTVMSTLSRRRGRASVTSLFSRPSTALTEIFKRLRVDRLPSVEEERETNL